VGKADLIKLLLFGGLLLAAATCTNGLEGIFARTESGGVITYALRIDLLVLMVVALVAMAMLADQWRRKKEDSWVLLAARVRFLLPGDGSYHGLRPAPHR